MDSWQPALNAYGSYKDAAKLEWDHSPTKPIPQGEMNSSADLGKFGFRTGLTLAKPASLGHCWSWLGELVRGIVKISSGSGSGQKIYGWTGPDLNPGNFRPD